MRGKWLALLAVVGAWLWQSSALVSAAAPELAVAAIRGGPLAPGLSGVVRFEAVPGGVWVTVEVSGLPAYRSGNPPIGPHGFHIHEGTSCEVGDPANPFQAAGGHFNPSGDPHGNHAGDLGVLFSNGGYSRMSVFTSRFAVADVIGRAVIIHENPDDFRTQPHGAAGRRLACGLIQPVSSSP